MLISAHEHKIIIQPQALDGEIVLEAEADLMYLFFIGENTPADASLICRLNGRGARANIFGFDLRAQGSHRLSLRLEYGAEQTWGHVWLTSVLSGSAKSKVDAMLKMEQTATGADGYFAHHTLLIPTNEQAKPSSHTRPALEILAHDIRAGHAATTSSLDPAMLLYLGTRGIASVSARRLLVEGFVARAITRIPDPTARQACEKIVGETLMSFWT